MENKRKYQRRMEDRERGTIFENITRHICGTYAIRVWFSRTLTGPSVEEDHKRLVEFCDANAETFGVKSQFDVAAQIAREVRNVGAVEVKNVHDQNGCVVYNNWP